MEDRPKFSPLSGLEERISNCVLWTLGTGDRNFWVRGTTLQGQRECNVCRVHDETETVAVTVEKILAHTHESWLD